MTVYSTTFERYPSFSESSPVTSLSSSLNIASREMSSISPASGFLQGEKKGHFQQLTQNSGMGITHNNSP